MRTFSLLFVALALAAACGSPTKLPAYIENRTDTVSLYALSGTPISTPSSYNIPFRTVVRTDQATQGFDIAFDIDTLRRPVLLPTGAMGLGLQSGIQRTLHAWDSVTVAPGSGYTSDSAVAVDSNAVMIMHSRPLTCSDGSTTAYFAKLHVLAMDTTSAPNGRRIDVEILTNINCGYRGLEPGLPKR